MCIPEPPKRVKLAIVVAKTGEYKNVCMHEEKKREEDAAFLGMFCMNSLYMGDRRSSLYLLARPTTHTACSLSMHTQHNIQMWSNNRTCIWNGLAWESPHGLNRELTECFVRLRSSERLYRAIHVCICQLCIHATNNIHIYVYIKPIRCIPMTKISCFFMRIRSFTPNSLIIMPISNSIRLLQHFLLSLSSFVSLSLFFLLLLSFFCAFKTIIFTQLKYYLFTLVAKECRSAISRSVYTWIRWHIVSHSIPFQKDVRRLLNT